jgi:nucleoside-triphosphatase THEP1
MELSSIAFNDALVKAVESNKPMLGTIHYGLSNSLVNSIKIRDETEILKVTYENREDLHIMIANRITEHLIGSE